MTSALNGQRRSSKKMGASSGWSTLFRSAGCEGYGVDVVVVDASSEEVMVKLLELLLLFADEEEEARSLDVTVLLKVVWPTVKKVAHVTL